MNSLNILKLLLSLSVPLVIGWWVLDYFFSGKKNFFLLEKLFLAYGIGFGCITLCMLYLSILGIAFNPLVTSFLLITPLVAVYFYKHYKSNNLNSVDETLQKVLPNNSKAFDLQCILLIVFIVGSLLLLFFRTMIVEKDSWDSWALWAFKAKIFFHHEMIPLDMFQVFKTARAGHWDYPQHVPLMETWVLMFLGYWNDQLPRIIFPLFHAGLCVVVFYFLLRHVAIKFALVGALFLATLGGLQNWTIGTYTEPVMLFYYITGFVLLYRWMSEQDNRLLILSAIFSGLAAWTKNDGTALLVSNIFILALFLILEKGGIKRICSRPLWRYIITGLIVVLPWTLFKIKTGLENDIINSRHLQLSYIMNNISRLKYVFEIFMRIFLNFKYWNILWITASVFLIYACFVPQKKRLKYILFSILLQFAIYIFLYLLIPHYHLKYYVPGTLQRLMLAPGILAILYCILMCEPSSSILQNKEIDRRRR